MRNPEVLLQSGAILPPNVSVPASDTLCARSFAHPAISGIVVRLVADTLAPGADAEMAVLGFGPPQVSPQLGHIQRRAPGFPGWVLLHDPANAKHALAVVQDLKKAGRRMVAKPGHAKDDLVALGGKLARSMPHFLPSYWEECGRMFLAVGNPTYAAQAFEKAREAERQFGLPVDEAVRAEAFLEFALAGALSAKSLGAYARSLHESPDKKQAFALFFHLCVRRTLGGVPPWAAMAKDLRALGKVAGVAVDAEEQRLIALVLAAPAMARAPAELWKLWQPQLKALAAADPLALQRILDLWPEPDNCNDSEAFQEQWHKLLGDIGAKAALERSAHGKPAAWIGKLVRWGQDHPAFAIGWLAQLAPRMVQDCVPVQLSNSDDDDYGSYDVGLLETALMLRVPLADPVKDASVDFDPWARDGADADDLARVVLDPRYGPLVAEALDDAIGDEDFEKAARNKPALRDARHKWLHEQIAELSGGGLIAVAGALETLEEKTSPVTYSEFPDALAQLQAVTVAPNLQMVLNAGIFDELGSPALEAVYAELQGAGPKKADVNASGCYPWLVLHTDKAAVVVGAQGPVFRHDFKLPKGARLSGMRYSGGQLLVVFRDMNYDGKGYWSSQPSALFDIDDVWAFGRISEPGALLGDGCVTEGNRALVPGAVPDDDETHFFSDGTRLWRWDDGERKGKLTETAGYRLVDPVTGSVGALDTPPFLQGDPPAGMRWASHDNQHWLPLPPGVTDSPLGARNGQAGLRVWESEPVKTSADPDDEGDIEDMLAESIDGQRWHGFVDGDTVVALLRYPGSSQPLGLVDSYSGAAVWHGAGADDDATHIQNLETDDDDERPAGTPLLPPLWFWHCFAPRDTAGSLALRALTVERCAQLVAAGLGWQQAQKTSKVKANDDQVLPVEVVAALLPEISHSGLRAGVAEQLAKAVDLAERLTTLVNGSTEVVDDDPEPFDDDAIVDALGRKLAGVGYASGELSQHLNAVLRALAAPVAVGNTELPATELPWLDWVGNEDALVFAACSLGVAHHKVPDAKTHILRLLRKLAALPWTAEPERFARLTLTFADSNVAFVQMAEYDPDDYEPDDPLPVADAWMHRDGARQWLVVRKGDATDRPVEVRCVTWSDLAEVTLPKGATGDPPTPIAAAPYRERLQAAIAVAEQNAFTTLAPGVAELIAERTGLTRAEAAWLWAGLPMPHSYAADFLGKPLRDALGLKVADGKAMKASLEDVAGPLLVELFAAAVPADPAQLLHPLDGAAERFAQAWLAAQGQRIALPAALLVEVERRLNPDVEARTLLTALVDPTLPSPFQRDGQWQLDAWGDVEQTDKVEDPFDGSAAVALARLIPFLATTLPVGDPMRASLPVVLQQARQRLAHPQLLFAMGTWYGDDRGKKRRKAWFEALGGTAFVAPKVDEDDSPVHGRDTGLLVVQLDDDACPSAAWRPAQVRDDNDWQTLRGVAALFNGDDNDTDSDGQLAAVQFLRSEGCLALAERAAQSPLAAGQWEQNPQHSAPELVDAVGQKLALDAHAAALYLQWLALAEPTQREVLVWNGWTPAVYKKATESLVAKGLALMGKRPRAGREHFLPGGWDEMASPDLPLESWKAPLYGLIRQANGKLAAPLGVVVPLRPVHEVFAAAWARVVAGDVPALEKAKLGSKK